VTQQPLAANLNPFSRISSNFSNHLPDAQGAPRGGHLWISYPGTNGRVLRNLSAEAGFGNNIAVRDPSVHWDGKKALVSMLVGANSRWQVYEVTGLEQGATPAFVRLNQPAGYNHISPIYDSNDGILMVSDTPRGGAAPEFAHLYPHLDEYDEAPTNSGLWRLDPASGEVAQLHHAPSGAFRPQIDSFGRVVFTQWDHLQRDQQVEPGNPHNLFNWPDESVSNKDNVQSLSGGGSPAGIKEVFPERFGTTDAYNDAGIHDLAFNFFMPWMINQDGTGVETLNHVGRHELGAFGFRSRKDPSLVGNEGAHGANRGFFPEQVKLESMHYLREDPLKPGEYYAVRAQEFGTHGGGCIVKILGEPTRRPQDMKATLLTSDRSCSSGGPAVFRSPLPTFDGKLLATYSTVTAEAGSGSKPYDYRLAFLKKNGSTFSADPSGLLTLGIATTVAGVPATMWELDPVEVVARPRPAATKMEPVPGPESQVFQESGVDITQFRAFLAEKKLALIVSRNVTRRDSFDRDQPFNLQVPGGAKSAVGAPNEIVYTIDHLQVFQADQLRGIQDKARGRRVLPQPMKPQLVGGKNVNPPAGAGAPVGSVKLAKDGSFAALVPTNRALTWQLVNSAKLGTPGDDTDGIVRERVWNSFRPGEVRVCANCHGVSEKDQTGKGPDDVQNPPQALRELLDYYKANLRTTSSAAGAAR
jgi:hypothetical protein